MVVACAAYAAPAGAQTRLGFVTNITADASGTLSTFYPVAGGTSKLTMPNGVAVHPSGLLYVSDTTGIWTITAAGVATRFAGGGGSLGGNSGGAEPVDGPVGVATFGPT